jgi:hypothetical protein
MCEGHFLPVYFLCPAARLLPRNTPRPFRGMTSAKAAEAVQLNGGVNFSRRFLQLPLSLACFLWVQTVCLHANY